MLKLITGGSHTQREILFIDSVKKQAENGSDVLVIIPDQFSFEYDKKLYSALGGKLFNKIKTAGFNRLSELVAKQYGSGSKDNADENAVVITMYKAVKRLKKTGDVRFFERALNKSSFVSEAILLINELVRSGITYYDLRIAAENVEGTLSAKLFDLSRLFQFYFEELEKAGLKNSLTSVGECCELAEKHSFFENKYVFIDSFNDFSADEYKLIESMMKQAEMITVSLVISQENKARINQSPFAETMRTLGNLKRLANAHNISVYETAVNRNDKDEFNADIAHIDSNLYCCKPDSLVNSRNVKLLSATDLYEETEYVCAEISRLIREENFKYKDIAVLAGNLNEISSVIEGTFERYEIPYFIDCKQGAGQSALVIYLKSIFDCVMSKNWNTEKLLKYIKSPLADFLDYDICDLENYCITWNVNGSMWNEDFLAEASEASLERINQTRKRVVEPLHKFKSACENATAQDICVAFYKLLDDIKLSQQMFSKIKIASSLENDEEFELAREFKQLWQTVLSAVSSIYTDMDNDIMSLREFYDVFSLMISRMTVSRPPQKADCVRIASTDHSRLSNVKTAFVMEANDGVFPAGIRNKGLLSLRDKKILEETGLSMIDNSLKGIESQRLNVYLSLTLPEDKLYVLYSESDSMGGLKSPSVAVSMMKKMFDGIENKIQNIDVEFFCTSYRTALYKYLEKSNDRRCNVASVGESLKSSAEYEEKLENILKNADVKSHGLSDEMANKLFFSNDLNMSATRIKDYYSCPFMYYCKYGLNLKKTYPVKINPVNTGNLIHSCFERIMSREDDKGHKEYDKNFVNLSDDIIKQTVHEEFQNYINDNLGGDFGKTASFKEAIKRLEASAFYNIKNIQTELEDSLFVPEAFEYKLTKTDGESILQLEVDKDIHINIRGSIDRVDIFTAPDGQRYVRIIDYKTGNTTLRLEDLYNGLNLQMLVYLLAVTQRKNDLNRDGNLKPSAILYSHINFTEAKFTPEEIRKFKEDDDLDDELMITRASSYKPDGMMIENEFTLKALNNRFNYSFTPFKLKSNGEINTNGNVLVTENYFLGLEQFALQKIYEMAKKLKCGEICADPIETSRSLVCSYCDYWAICGNSSPKAPRKTDKKRDTEKLNEEIKALMENKT